MKVKIFTEGGYNIGLGHISRCSSLYDEIVDRGIDVEFIIYGDIKNLDILKGRTVKNDNWLSVDYLKNYINDTDYCIVDSYLASKDLYEIISAKAKRALFIDDVARIKYPPGIIVNPSLNTENINYPINDDNDYLLGHEFIILRSSFINNERKNINKDVKEVLITMGGADIRDLTPKIIKNICKSYPDINFNIVVSDTFHNINSIKSEKLSNTELYYSVDEQLMKELMVKSDIAITAAGQTIYELLATMTPFIPIKIIDNQSNNIDGLRKINPEQVVIEFDDENFMKKLNKEFKGMLKMEQRMKWFEIYRNRIDGFGRGRIIDKLFY